MDPTEALSCEKAGTDSGTAVAQRPQPREFRKLPHGKTRKGRSEKCRGAQLALPPLMLALTLCGHGAVHGASVPVQIFGGLFAVLGFGDQFAQFAQPQHRATYRRAPQPVAGAQADGREGLLHKRRVDHRELQCKR